MNSIEKSLHYSVGSQPSARGKLKLKSCSFLLTLWYKPAHTSGMSTKTEEGFHASLHIQMPPNLQPESLDAGAALTLLLSAT